MAGRRGQDAGDRFQPAYLSLSGALRLADTRQAEAAFPAAAGKNRTCRIYSHESVLHLPDVPKLMDVAGDTVARSDAGDPGHGREGRVYRHHGRPPRRRPS
jgi:hypothetical protein